MARTIKPEKETKEQAKERKILDSVANFSKRGEKTSWNRKQDKMVRLLATLQPIEDQIVELQAQKVPIFDEVQELRETMVEECVHPKEYLVLKEDHVLCKFCNRKISIPNG